MERKKETKVIEKNGKKVKVERYEGDTLWVVVEEKKNVS